MVKAVERKRFSVITGGYVGSDDVLKEKFASR
jgi:hypothetical protein